jgi:hypothetical protein
MSRRLPLIPPAGSAACGACRSRPSARRRPAAAASPRSSGCCSSRSPSCCGRVGGGAERGRRGGGPSKGRPDTGRDTWPHTPQLTPPRAAPAAPAPQLARWPQRAARGRALLARRVHRSGGGGVGGHAHAARRRRARRRRRLGPRLAAAARALAARPRRAPPRRRRRAGAAAQALPHKRRLPFRPARPAAGGPHCSLYNDLTPNPWKPLGSLDRPFFLKNSPTRVARLDPPAGAGAVRPRARAPLSSPHTARTSSAAPVGVARRPPWHRKPPQRGPARGPGPALKHTARALSPAHRP